MKKRNPEIKWIAVIHHQAKLSFKNLLTFLTSLGSFLAQQATWQIISKHGSLVLLYDSDEGRMISKLSKFNHKKLGFIQNGINFELIEKSKPAANSLDLLLCGGPRQSKGVLDLPSILNLVKLQYPNVRVGLAGHGTPHVISILHTQLESVGMASNVKFFGNLPKEELYSLMKSSQIVISLSYEEGWGIAVREALACGRPCVAYRIPAFHSLGEYLNFVELGNIEAMSQEIIALLDTFNEKKFVSYKPVGASWREVAQKELAFILGEIS
jgi:glycosyltransferase involved in cell wall biosynthesis